MWNVVVCDGDEREREEILEYVRLCCSEKKWEVSLEGCIDWPELYEKIGERKPDIIIIAQNGVEGLNTITSIHLSATKFIWFSDLDFGVQAYRLCVNWFSRKPVTHRKMEQALTRCIGTG